MPLITNQMKSFYEFFSKRMKNTLAGVVFLAVFENLTAALIFEDGFEEGWSKWNEVPAVAEHSATSREGEHAVLFKPNPEGIRSEFVIGAGKGNFAWGEEYWIGFSIMVTVQPKGYRVISQHHSTPAAGPDGYPNWTNCVAGANSFTIIAYDGSFSVRTSTNAELTFVVPENGGASSGTEGVDKPFDLNRWYDFVLHFRYANDETGLFEIWMDGEKIVNVQDSPTVYNFDLCGLPKTPQQYQKIGIYHGPKQQIGEILYDAYRIGDENSSYEEVAPRGEKFGALDDRYNAEKGEVKQMNVLENDMGSDLIVVSVSPGENGSTTTDGTTVTYTPNAGFEGNDSFTYTMGNNGGKTDTGTVSIFTLPTAPELTRQMPISIKFLNGKFNLFAQAPEKWEGLGQWYYSIKGSTTLESWSPILQHNKVGGEGQDISVNLSDLRISRYKYFQMISWLE